MKKDPAVKIIIISAILYTVWVGFYLVFSVIDMPPFLASFLSLFQQQETTIRGVSFGFIAVSLICAVIVAGRIEALKYTPFILLAVFILSGRLISFTGAFIFIEITGKTLFLVPFGSIDFFLFHFLVIGLLGFLEKEEDSPQKAKFNIIMALPVLLFIFPVLIHVKPDGFTFLSIYSLVFTTVAVVVMIKAITFYQVYPSGRLITVSLIIAGFLDMLIYLNFLIPGEYVPPMLNYLLLPYSLFLFTYAIISYKRGVK